MRINSEMNIIIDGYNLIRQSDSLRRFERLGLEAGRNELIRRLSRFKKMRGHEITVVFDGWISGSPKEEHHREAGITVIYSKIGEKADEVIKRMAKKGSAGIVIVTSDRSIADSIGRNGGVAVSSPEFERKIQMIEGGISLARGDPRSKETDDYEQRISGKKKGPSKRLPRKKGRHRPN